MKGFRLIFALFLGLWAFQPARAADSDDTARAATRRGASSVVAAARGNSTATAPQSTTGASRITNATNNKSTTTNSTQTVRGRGTATTTTTRGTNVVADTGRTATTRKTVSTRTTSGTQTRGAASTNVISAPSRAAIVRGTIGAPKTTTSVSQPTGAASRASVSRAATTTAARAAATSSARRTTGASSRVARAATTTNTVDSVINSNYKKCREVYYNCMDEFCANKDSQLKRCACSSRVNEFDSTKKRLANVEEKMLDFNQRLLTVNMDKEDAAALNQATEGETAFLQKDTSKSKQMLDDISKKLNASFNDTNFNQSMTSISLSLDTDSAFDTVDSLQAASTTAKTGTALYSAALPICREMATEVCSDDELSLAESGYQMVIEQDCNAVQKSYQTQVDQARDKVREGSALLDMSRLDVYQERNSDDILTCKEKMLTMLTDSTVCGDGLGKCLDTTGQYIDPSTGEALLSDKLVNLANLIVRPSADQEWTSVPANQVFVTYLNSKKTFLAPAMENCQDIADAVWDAFIEDALAQIKLAQTKKLEDVRQSCTTLTTQCLTDTTKTIQDFDARALSTFGVLADKTVNEMCTSIKNACTAVLNYSVTGDAETDSEWTAGMNDIATDKTYDTLMQTCREVGRACIIQACKSVSGNFGLCEDIQTSVNRKSIINRTACWDEVQKCIEQTGDASIKAIFARKSDPNPNETKTKTDTVFANQQEGYKFYSKLYNNLDETETCSADTTDNNGSPAECGVYDLCRTSCRNSDSTECMKCRLTERIWGNCEFSPEASLSQSYSHNYIKTSFRNSDDETLLSWFAKNTNTNNNPESCRDTSCPPGQQLHDGVCVDKSTLTDDDVFCPPEKFWQINIKTKETDKHTDGIITNCCNVDNTNAGQKDVFGNCCLDNIIDGLPGGDATTDNDNTSFFLRGTSDKSMTFGEKSSGTHVKTLDSKKTPHGLCLPSTSRLVAKYQKANDNAYVYVICTSGAPNTSDGPNTETTKNYPDGQKLTCTNGEYVYVVVTDTTKDTSTTQAYFYSGRYLSPTYTMDQDGKNTTNLSVGTSPAQSYKASSTQQCNLTYPKGTDLDLGKIAAEWNAPQTSTDEGVSSQDTTGCTAGKKDMPWRWIIGKKE